jgi:hypothetical protein
MTRKVESSLLEAKKHSRMAHSQRPLVAALGYSRRLCKICGKLGALPGERLKGKAEAF